MKTIRFASPMLILIIACLCGTLSAQSPPAPAFEVASIKAAPPLTALVMEIQSGKRGVGSLVPTINETRADFGYVSLNSLLMYAFRMKTHQITGPDWLGSEAFEIHAKIPEGASKDQVPEMMQSLLAERFKLAAHQEMKELPVYALTVSADGHRLKEAPAPPRAAAAAGDPPDASPEKRRDDKNTLLSVDTPEGNVDFRQKGNGMVIDGGKTGQVRINMNPDGSVSYEIERLTMADFAVLLTQFLDKPVVDRTGLNGSYQISLGIPMEEMLGIAQRLAPRMGMSLPPGIGNSGSLVGANPGAGGLSASSPAGGGLFQAVRKLGLKLDSDKVPTVTLVVDHIEKVPTEN